MQKAEILQKLETKVNKIKQCIQPGCEINIQDIENLQKYIVDQIDEYKSYQTLEYINNNHNSITFLSSYKPSPKVKLSEKIIIVYKLNKPKYSESIFKPMLDSISSFFNNNYNEEEVQDLVNKSEQMISSSSNNYQVILNQYLVIIHQQDMVNYCFQNRDQQQVSSQIKSQQQEQQFNSLSIDFYSFQFFKLRDRLNNCKGLIELVIFFRFQPKHYNTMIQNLKNLLKNNQETLQKISLTFHFNLIQTNEIQEVGQLIFNSKNITHFKIGQLYEFKYWKTELYPLKKQNRIFLLKGNESKGLNLFEQASYCCHLKYLCLQIHDFYFNLDCNQSLISNINKFSELFYLNIYLSTPHIDDEIIMSLLGNSIGALKKLRCLYLSLNNNIKTNNGYKGFLKGLFKCDYLSILELELGITNKSENNQLKLLIYKNLKRLVHFKYYILEMYFG